MKALTELTPICVLSLVCHWEKSRNIVFEFECFVLKLFPIYAQTSCSISLQKVTCIYMAKKKRLATIQTKDFEMFYSYPPWTIKSFITLWKVDPLYPTGILFCLNSPVQNWRKFSAVFGTACAKSSILSLPTATSLIDISKKTIGFFGSNLFWCSSMLVAIFDFFLIFTTSKKSCVNN